MNGRIRKLGVVLLVCYVALFVQLNYIQVYEAESLNTSDENRRPVQAEFENPRGKILSYEGVELARSVASEGVIERRREYPQGDLFGQVTGFYSLFFGVEGVEKFYDAELAGRTVEQRAAGFFDGIFDERDLSGDVRLTLRDDVQRVARDQLGQRDGSVVALDPRTGALLAMWSYPSYDPTLLSSLSQEDATVARDFFLALPGDPLLAKPYRERYAPGSTFKIVTAAAGLESGRIGAADPVYPSVESYTPPLTTRPLQNFGGNTCGGDLFDILRRSCNAAFAQMAAEDIGPEPMITTARAFGFNSEMPIDLPNPAVSNFPEDFGKLLNAGTDDAPAGVYENTPALAQSAIGQNDVSATPLQMALVAAAVANRGTVMQPHVLEEITDQAGIVIATSQDRELSQAMRPASAGVLREAMIGVVEGGTASGLAIDGMVVGGKTGTAQLGTDPPRSHAWIIGFAGPPGEDPSVAVAVLVEGQEGASEQTGGRVAAPIARAVLEAALVPAVEPVRATAPLLEVPSEG